MYISCFLDIVEFVENDDDNDAVNYFLNFLFFLSWTHMEIIAADRYNCWNGSEFLFHGYWTLCS